VLSPEEAGAEKRLAEATEYSHKIRERAAQILTASQLAVYDEMQAEAMRQLQFSLRENDKRLAKPER
jgi:predicted nucleic acid-binding protein